MKTAAFPSVVEARKAAYGQLGFYRTMMADISNPPESTKRGKATKSPQKAKAAKQVRSK